MAEVAHVKRMSADEYMAFEQASPVKSEYVRGELFAMAGTTDRHNDVAGNIYAVARSLVRGGPCRAYIADVKLRIDAADVFFYPDVFVTCDARDRDDPLVKRHAVLVVEVLSDSTAEYDRADKFADYRRIETLREYVLVDSRVRRVDVFRRTAAGWAFESVRSGEVLRLESIQAELPVAALYEDTDVPDRAPWLRGSDQDTPS